MNKTVALKDSPPAGVNSAQVFIYPAVADCVDLPDFYFRRRKDEQAFAALTSIEDFSFLKKNKTVYDMVTALDDGRLKTLLAPLGPESAGYNITLHIIGRRAPVLKVKQDGINLVVEAHWNLFIPYFERIKTLPIVHPENLGIFAGAVFYYVFQVRQHPLATKNEWRDIVIDGYRNQPEYLLASLDIFNKANIYHIHPAKSWLGRILTANDLYRLEIDVSAAVHHVRPEFLEEVASFLHKVVKNYVFRYADYLWTQKYRITFGPLASMGLVEFAGNDIIVNINPLIDRVEWKPALYLNLGYAIMLSILQSSGREDKKENIYLAVMKTWNRYLSFDEAGERQNVRDIFRLSQPNEEARCSGMLECMRGEKSPDLVDDFIMLMNYSSKETFVERLNILNESRYEKRTRGYFEQLWNPVRDLNTTLMKNNINYGKLIEILRNDNIDHHQLAVFLCTGRLGNIDVVDVSEWHLLKTLLYDLINSPKVFRNDYKMLLKVLTKVNKSLIVYIWALGLNNDARYEMVSAYIARLMTDIFVFNRVKIYEIVADPVECLEAEAVTGYLLNWASVTREERRSIMERVLSALPHNVVAHLCVQTPTDVDRLVHALDTGTSGLFGFYLHQAYRWGSTKDQVTQRIRFHFPELLRLAQGAILPAKRIQGGAMLLLLLAQIISDQRDGFAGNVAVTEEERNIIRDLIKQCVDWDEKHFVIMVAGIAAGYMGSIDGWILQQFDALLGRYDGGDRVVLRSVVQFDVENLIERALITASDEDASALLNKIKLLRFGVDPVVSDQVNKYFRAMFSRYGLGLPETVPTKKNIRELVLTLSQLMKAQLLDK